jgi:hypothetical protein
MSCLFCGYSERNYIPTSGNDFICSHCVQMLISADQEDLKRAHSKAIEKGLTNKARAIESFLIPEEVNVRKTEKLKRNMGRKRPMRTSRPSRDKIRA